MVLAEAQSLSTGAGLEPPEKRLANESSDNRVPVATVPLDTSLSNPVLEVVVEIQIQNGSSSSLGTGEAAALSLGQPSSTAADTSPAPATPSSSLIEDLRSPSSSTCSCTQVTPPPVATAPFPSCNATSVLAPTGGSSASLPSLSSPTASLSLFAGGGASSAAVRLSNLLLALGAHLAMIYTA
ncbi:hypothetical protein F5Y02DRAFT_430709 [Annulohypoxylon stygium]|nr:hypothetical protein F5Y02DRAFT_430709 [Annulohypoxylon stygium]